MSKKNWSGSDSNSGDNIVGIGLDYPLWRVRSEARGPAIALEVFLTKEAHSGHNFLSMEWHEATSWGAYVSPNGVDCRAEIGFGDQHLILEGRYLHKPTLTKNGTETISVLSGLSQHRAEAIWQWGRHFKDIDDSEHCFTAIRMEFRGSPYGYAHPVATVK